MSIQNQGKATRGSQFWLQKLINEQPEALNNAIVDVAPALAGQMIEWVSPLASEGYCEFRDRAFLKKLGVQLTERPLESFGPKEGLFGMDWPERRLAKSFWSRLNHTFWRRYRHHPGHLSNR